MNMWPWLAKINPNVIATLAVALGSFIYHHLSPSTQTKVNEALTTATNTALSTAETVMDVLVATAPKGTTATQLEGQLWAEAKIQLAHIGIDVTKIPPAVQSAAQALVTKYLTKFTTTNIVNT